MLYQLFSSILLSRVMSGFDVCCSRLVYCVAVNQTLIMNIIISGFAYVAQNRQCALILLVFLLQDPATKPLM